MIPIERTIETATVRYSKRVIAPSATLRSAA
jgi:hypothetical protein